MRSTLCEAVARCHLRRLRGIAASAPLPAAVMALVVAAAPVLLFRLGGARRRRGGEQHWRRRAFPTASCSGRCSRPPSPARRLRSRHRRDRRSGIRSPPAHPAGVAVIALALVPVTAGSIVVVPSLVAVCVGLAGALPGGMGPGLALAAATLAAVPAGAVVAEGALGAGRGQRRRALAVLVGGLGWLAVGLALGSAPLGPLAVVSAALRDAGSPWVALVVSCAVGVALAAGWVLLAATRPVPRSRRRAVGRSARRRLPAPIAAVVLLARRGDLRLATVGATLFGLAGAALAAATDAPPPAPFLLGTTTALLGSLLCPLVVGGMLDDGRWLWRSAPVRSGAIARSFALASTAAAAVPVAVVGGVALAASGGGAGSSASSGRSSSSARAWHSRGRSAPLARAGSRRSDDHDCRVRGDRDRRVVRRRARRPASRRARRSRPGHRGRDLRRVLATGTAALDRRLGAAGR